MKDKKEERLRGTAGDSVFASRLEQETARSESGRLDSTLEEETIPNCSIRRKVRSISLSESIISNIIFFQRSTLAVLSGAFDGGIHGIREM